MIARKSTKSYKSAYYLNCMLGVDRTQTTRKGASLWTEFILVKGIELIRNHYLLCNRKAKHFYSKISKQWHS